MTREKLTLFDTTLRDGAQMAGVDFSLADKRHIAALLDGLGVRLYRGRLSRRQSARYGIFRRKTEIENRPFRGVRHDQKGWPLRRQ